MKVVIPVVVMSFGLFFKFVVMDTPTAQADFALDAFESQKSASLNIPMPDHALSPAEQQSLMNQAMTMLGMAAGSTASDEPQKRKLPQIEQKKRFDADHLQAEVQGMISHLTGEPPKQKKTSRLPQIQPKKKKMVGFYH